MKGRHHIVVQNNRVRYEIDVKRNLTIIRGDSATGKTTLVQMLSQYADLGEDSGISVVCDKDIQVLSGRNWKRLLDTFDDQIIFIDEENAFIKTEEFAAAVLFCIDHAGGSAKPAIFCRRNLWYSYIRKVP